MILRALHRTTYEYASPAVDSHNEVRLMPRTDEFQSCLDCRIETTPASRVFEYKDLGGPVHHFAIREPHRRLEIVAEATVQTLLVNPFEGLNLMEPDWAFYGWEGTRQANVEYLTASPYVPLFAEAEALAGSVREAGQSAAGFLLALNRRVYDLLDYQPGATHVHSTPVEALALKAGVCQDYAHLTIACCRAVGIPARYVSGYLYGETLRGDQATHAWVEALLPTGRWLSLDPTNNLLANDRYIRVHLGRDYSDVSPTRGIYTGPSAARLEVSVRVSEALPSVH